MKFIHYVTNFELIYLTFQCRYLQTVPFFYSSKNLQELQNQIVLG